VSKFLKISKKLSSPDNPTMAFGQNLYWSSWRRTNSKMILMLYRCTQVAAEISKTNSVYDFHYRIMSILLCFKIYQCYTLPNPHIATHHI